MDYSSMMSFLSNCHIGLNLSVDTPKYSLIGIGSSRKNFTYMSSGMVVITSETGLIGQAVAEERCGFIVKDVNNAAEIACLIERIYNDRQMAVNLAKNGISAIKNKYNWEKESTKLLKVYNKIFN